MYLYARIREMKRSAIKSLESFKLPGGMIALILVPFRSWELRECTDARSNEFRRFTLSNSILISIAPYSRDHFRLPCQTNTEKLFQTLITCAAKPYLVTLVSKTVTKSNAIIPNEVI